MDYVYLDTEFNRKDFSSKGLVSIALVAGNDVYYAVNGEMDLQKIVGDPEIGAWMTENIFEPHILTHSMRRLRQTPDVKDYDVISAEVNAFLKAACPTGSAKDDIEIIVNCGAQDMVRLHTLLADNDFGRLGPWVPYGSDDMYRIKRKAYRLGLRKEELPVQRPETAHHALYDAEYEREVHQFIRDRYGKI